MKLTPNGPVVIEVARQGRVEALKAEPQVVEQKTSLGIVRSRVLGVSSSSLPEHHRLVKYGFIDSIELSCGQIVGLIKQSVNYLGGLIRGREKADQLSGPIGIARASGAIADQAVEGAQSFGEGALRLFFSLLTLAGLLSVAVGFFNLLPVPILDGGHLVFYAYEAVARRPLNAQFQEAGFRVGLALLVGLMLFATWNDLNKLNLFAFLGGTS